MFTNEIDQWYNDNNNLLLTNETENSAFLVFNFLFFIISQFQLTFNSITQCMRFEWDVDLVRLRQSIEHVHFIDKWNRANGANVTSEDHISTLDYNGSECFNPNNSEPKMVQFVEGNSKRAENENCRNSKCHVTALCDCSLEWIIWETIFRIFAYNILYSINLYSLGQHNWNMKKKQWKSRPLWCILFVHFRSENSMPEFDTTYSSSSLMLIFSTLFFVSIFTFFFWLTLE